MNLTKTDRPLEWKNMGTRGGLFPKGGGVQGRLYEPRRKGRDFLKKRRWEKHGRLQFFGGERKGSTW